MNSAILLIAGWVVLAFILAAIPSKDRHWRLAYVLMAIGVPLLIWITWAQGILYGLLGLAVGGLVLRWPVIYLYRRIRSVLGG